MTRKRYKKQLMGLGLSRDEATCCADTAREKHGSYAAGGREFARLILHMLHELNAERLPQMQGYIADVRRVGGGAAE